MFALLALTEDGVDWLATVPTDEIEITDYVQSVPEGHEPVNYVLVPVVKHFNL